MLIRAVGHFTSKCYTIQQIAILCDRQQMSPQVRTFDIQVHAKVTVGVATEGAQGARPPIQTWTGREIRPKRIVGGRVVPDRAKRAILQNA